MSHAENVNGILEKVEREEKLCDEVETVRELTYLVDRVSEGEAAVIARTICGWCMLKECGELLYDRRLHLNLKGVVHKGYVKPAIFLGSEAWCVK